MKKSALGTKPGRDGFTLLEMAIVVAIIGLLIGGMLSMQTFLNNSKLNSLVIESKYYINAFEQFSQVPAVHRAVAGDFSNAGVIWPGAGNGDGNGLIRAAATTTSLGNSELFLVFQHLSRAGLIKGSYSGATKSGAAAGSAVAAIDENIPHSVLPNVGFIFDHPDDPGGVVSATDPIYFTGKYGHVMRVGMADTYAGLTDKPVTTPFLKPRDMLKIDDKYDDAAPGTGWVTSANNSGSPAGLHNCAASVGAYNVDFDTEACFLILNIQN